VNSVIPTVSETPDFPPTFIKYFPASVLIEEVFPTYVKPIGAISGS